MKLLQVSQVSLSGLISKATHKYKKFTATNTTQQPNLEQFTLEPVI
jgi:hypothetical protein